MTQHDDHVDEYTAHKLNVGDRNGPAEPTRPWEVETEFAFATFEDKRQAERFARKVFGVVRWVG